jgi:hypothetical protein
MPPHVPQSHIPIAHRSAKRCRYRCPDLPHRSTAACLGLTRLPGCSAPTPATLAHAFCAVPCSPRIAGWLTNKGFLIQTAEQLLRVGIHRQDRVHKESLGFVPTSDGTQTLGCLMTGKVDVCCVCCQQHARVLDDLLAGGHPMGKHDLLVRHGIRGLQSDRRLAYLPSCACFRARTPTDSPR